MQREMEELLDGLDRSLRVTGMIGDSIMMGIVNSSMEEAYKSILSSREGGLECLNDKSRFCGLAIMQLEWCLRFLQGEVDACVVESDDAREKLVGDLRVTRDRIQRRLEETVSAISEKERELEDMIERQSELRRALEDRDEQLRTLHMSLDQERARHGGAVEWMSLGDKAGEEMVGDEKIALSEMRISVVQHVEDFSCKLLETKNHVSDLIQKLGTHCVSTAESLETLSRKVEEEGFSGSLDKLVHEIIHMNPNGCPEIQPGSDPEMFMCILRTELESLFQQLSLDMAILKRLLEAIPLSKVTMYEQQLCWRFEKETLYVLLENFQKDLEERHYSKFLQEPENGSWSSVMKDFATWQSNLEQVAIQLDKQLESDNLVETATSDTKDIVGENSIGHPPYLTVEIKRNHDHTVRKKAREATRLRTEISRGKRLPFFHGDRELRSMKTKLSEIFSKLECFLEESTKPPVISNDSRSANQMDGLSLQDNLSRSESAGKVNDVVHTSNGAPRKISNQMAFYPMADDICEETRCLKEHREDSYLENMVLEQTNSIFFNVFVKEMYLEIIDYKLETFFREDICRFVFSEAMNERNHEIETHDFRKENVEETDRIVFSHLIPNTRNASGLCLKRCNEECLPCPSTFFQGPWIDEDVVQGTGDRSISFEVKGNLQPNPNSEIEVQMHSVWNSQISAQQSPNYAETLDENNTFCSVRNKPEKAQQQITISKMQLRELESDLGVSVEEKECAVDKLLPFNDIGQAREQTSYLHIRNKEEGLNEIQSVVTHLTSFSRDVLDLELMVYEKSQANMSRLEELNRQVNLLVQQAASLRKEELLYRKAFLRRCYNLQTAEAEVWWICWGMK